MGIYDTVLYAFCQSDMAGKIIVLLLLGMGCYSWDTIISKALDLRPIVKANQRFLQRFETIKSPLQMENERRNFDCLLSSICHQGVVELLDILQADAKDKNQMFRHNYLPRPLTHEEIEKIQTTMLNAEAKTITAMEEKMMMMGTFISLSPFLGLFGTVWGVMATFIGIAQAGRPDLMAIAPGISGALLTTVAGLMVAIPALVGNNILLGKIQRITREMDSFIDAFISELQIQHTQESAAPTSAPAAANTPVAATPQFSPQATAASAPAAAGRQTSFNFNASGAATNNNAAARPAATPRQMPLSSFSGPLDNEGGDREELPLPEIPDDADNDNGEIY